MKRKIQYLFRYINYRRKAKYAGSFGVHSPFLYNLINAVLENKYLYYAMDDIWELRQELSADKTIIEVSDFGAGSQTLKSNKRKLCDIVKNSAINEKFGEILFRFIVYFRPKNIIELGTSLGLGTLYLALPDSRSKVYTIEGCPETAEIAKDNFELLEVKNIFQHIGNFDTILPEILQKIESCDFVFFDGNHTEEATLRYFYMCLPKVNEKTVFIFDDINWSSGMKQAWNTIIQNPKKTMSIDIFRFGIVFFNKDLSKQNFIVKIIR